MRALDERSLVEPPHLLERGVVKAQAPVRAEHRDALGEIVERRALDADLRVVARFERHLFGDVVENDQDAAERVAWARPRPRGRVGKGPGLVGLAARPLKAGAPHSLWIKSKLA